MNTSYFHASLKSRTAVNIIDKLVNNEGVILIEKEDIEEEILKFYRELLGRASSTLTIIDVRPIRKGLMLIKLQRQELIRVMSLEEIGLALKGIDKDSYLDPDGMNSFVLYQGLS